MARDLLWICERSTDTLTHLIDGGHEPPEPEEVRPEDFRSLVRVVMARLRAERAVYASDPPPDVGELKGKFEAEFFCLLATLRETADALLRDAEIATRLAKEETRGRPKKFVSNALLAHSGAQLRRTPEPTRPVGRPLKVQIDDEALLYFVEQWPQKFGDADLGSTLRELATCYLRDTNALPESNWRRGTEVDRIVVNLRKRVSALRVMRRKGRAKD